jgi:NitT/TauT family transport system permease protein
MEFPREEYLTERFSDMGTPINSKKDIKFNVKDVTSIFSFLIAFLIIWQIVFSLQIWPVVSLPSPAMVAQSFVDLVQENILIQSIIVSLWRLFIGFVISVVIGGCVGLVMVKFKQFGKTMNSFALGLQSFPSIAWVPFAILLIGFNDLGILFVIVMNSVFSVMTTTYSAFRNIPPIYIHAARNMGANGFLLFRNVMIPASAPSLIMGLRQAWSFAWHALIGAEVLITTGIGLGYILSVGREFSNMSQIIATMIVIFAIGLIFDRFIFSRLEDKVRERWGLTSS